MARLERLALGALMIALTALAGGCAKDLAPPGAPTFSFADQPPVTLKGKSITIENAYVPSPAMPSVEQSYAVTPADIARAFTRDRLRAAGTSGRVVVRILEASVVEDQLPTKPGFTGLFVPEEDRKFDGRLRVEILVYGPPEEKEPGRILVDANASRTLLETRGPHGSQADYYALLNTLAENFDRALTQQLNAYSVGY